MSLPDENKEKRGNHMGNQWIFCPVCRSKTRIQIRRETELKCFPLFCPKCKQETLIDVKNHQVSIVREPDAKTQRRIDAEPINA